MIDYAGRELFSSVQRIWRTCFGDNSDYTGFLFDRLLGPEDVLAYFPEPEKPAAMLCLQPFTLATPHGNADAAYIFGVATLPEWRGKGLSTALLEEAGRRLAAKGTALSALVPAGEKMFDFYAKRGYETAFSVKKAVYRAEQVSAREKTCSLTPTPFSRLAEMRDAFFAGRTLFVRWGTHYLDYIDAETRALGGDVLSISCENHEGYVVCYPYRQSLIVKEWAVPEEMFAATFAALHARYRREEYRFHLPADSTVSQAGQPIPFAMTRWYDRARQAALLDDTGGAAYMAHVLDGPTLGVPLRQI